MSPDDSVKRLEADQQSRGPRHVEWVRSFLGLLDELKTSFTRWPSHGTPRSVMPLRNITSPITFTQGGSVADFKLDGPSACPSAPPPPPTAHTTPAGPAAVFAESTKGLKKVGPSQMTYKNLSLRRNETVPSGPGTCTSTIKRFG